jgi:protein TonB
VNARPLLRLEDKLAAGDAHLRALGRGDQRSRLTAALIAAIVVHALCLFVPARRAAGDAPPPPPRAEFPAVVRWIPGAAEAGRASIAAPRPPSDEATRARAASAIADESVDELARLDAFAGAEPVPEPPPRVATALPRDAEAQFGAVVPPPPPPGDGAGVATPIVRPTLVDGGRVDPRYPPAARAMRVPGRVVLEVEVHADGTVGEVTVLDASRQGLGFEAAAVAAVKRWRFRPGTRGGVPVTATTQVEVRFR